MGFGTLPYGASAFGAGASSIYGIPGFHVRSANEIWVSVDSLSGLPSYDPDSELSVNSWTITAVESGTFERLVQHVELVESRSEAIAAGAVEFWDAGFAPAIRVFTDGPLQPESAYSVDFLNSTIGPGEVTALTVGAGSVEVVRAENPDTIEDFKNPQFSRDKLPLGQLGSYNITDDGDIGVDDGPASLRKRIVRRITSAVASFYHLPGYGTDLELKGRFTPDTARRIKERVNSGVLSEPDVLRATTRVYAVTGEDGFFVVTVTAKTRSGETISASERVSTNG